MNFGAEGHSRLAETIMPMLARILPCRMWPVFFGALSLAYAAGFSNEPRVNPDHVAIHVNSDLVQIPVTVLDHDNRFVAGLDKESLRLFDDRVEQVITHFAMEDAPLSIGFVFDASASMHYKMQQSREAVTSFLKTTNPGDEVFLVEFNDHVELAVDPSASTQEIQTQLKSSGPPQPLLDAVDFSISRMKKPTNARKALIIISDGGDNCSRYTMAELKNLVRETDVQVYALGIFNSREKRSQIPEELYGPSLLRSVTKQSGGHLFEIADVNQLPDVGSKIGAALRAQYVLGYSPKVTRDGKYHRVEVKLAQPKGSRKLQASWRHGYYAPVE
jgi:Ca-activated chloride channel family protein